jgi:hypothetical protein
MLGGRRPPAAAARRWGGLTVRERPRASPGARRREMATAPLIAPLTAPGLTQNRPYPEHAATSLRRIAARPQRGIFAQCGDAPRGPGREAPPDASRRATGIPADPLEPGPSHARSDRSRRTCTQQIARQRRAVGWGQRPIHTDGWIPRTGRRRVQHWHGRRLRNQVAREYRSANATTQRKAIMCFHLDATFGTCDATAIN